MTDVTPGGVVLDEPLAHAVLYAALSEGLADSNPQIGDGFVRGILRHPPSQAQLDAAFER